MQFIEAQRQSCLGCARNLSRPLYSAIILAGGRSSRLRRRKALVNLAGSPLIQHVHRAVRGLADEVVIVVKESRQCRTLTDILPETECVVDDPPSVGPLSGIYGGLKRCSGNYVVVLGCDLPFVSSEVLKLLLRECRGKSAAVPMWPNGQIEPLHAVYCREPSLVAAEQTLREGRRSIRALLERLPNVLYVSTEALKELDPDVLTFYNVNSASDLDKAEHISRSRSLGRA